MTAFLPKGRVDDGEVWIFTYDRQDTAASPLANGRADSAEVGGVGGDFLMRILLTGPISS